MANGSTPQEVRNFHNRDDVDSGVQAHHHTLGQGANQAFPGARGKRLEDLVNANQADLIAEILALGTRIDWLEQDEMMVASAVPPGTHSSTGNWVAAGGFNTAWAGYPGTTISLPGNENLFGYSNGVITPTVPIWVEISFSQEWAGNATGKRGITLAMDGVNTNTNPQMTEMEPSNNADPFYQNVTYTGPLIPGHTINMEHYQNSGGNLVVNARHVTVRAKKIHVTGLS